MVMGGQGRLPEGCAGRHPVRWPHRVSPKARSNRVVLPHMCGAFGEVRQTIAGKMVSCSHIQVGAGRSFFHRVRPVTCPDSSDHV